MPKKSAKPKPFTMVRLVPEIAEKVRQAAEITGLPQAQVARLSIERGLKVLLTQLDTETSKSA